MTEPVTNEYLEQRLANMRALAAKGHAPFGRAFARTGRLADVRAAFEENKVVSVAGRLTTSRDMGKSIFADLRDGSDRLQIYAQKNVLGEEAYDAFKLLDLGDMLQAVGLAGSEWRHENRQPNGYQQAKGQPFKSVCSIGGDALGQ